MEFVKIAVAFAVESGAVPVGAAVAGFVSLVVVVVIVAVQPVARLVVVVAVVVGLDYAKSADTYLVRALAAHFGELVAAVESAESAVRPLGELQVPNTAILDDEIGAEAETGRIDGRIDEPAAPLPGIDPGTNLRHMSAAALAPENDDV